MGEKLKSFYIFLFSVAIFLLVISGWTQITWAALPGWDNKATVRIDNTGGAELTNYPVLVELNTSGLIDAGKMQSDGADIRFLDSDDTANLSYWIGAGINTTSTSIWVKVPTVPADDTKEIYLYYTNAGAAAATDGDNTFVFFDDFDALDGGVWTQTGSASVANSKLTVATGAVYTSATVGASSANQLVESQITWINNSGTYSGMMMADDHATAGGNSGADAFVYSMTDSGGGSNLRGWAGDGTTTGYNLSSNGLLYPFTVGETDIVGQVTTSDNTVKWFKDYSETRSVAGTWDEAYYVWFGYFVGSVSGGSNVKDIAVDWVRVRQYVADEPTTNVYLPIAQLAVTTTEQTILKNDPSSVITIAAQSAEGITVSAETDITITLATDGSGTFSLTNSPWNAVTEATISADTSTINVYYKDGLAGAKELTFSENPSAGYTDATHDITVTTYSGRTTEEDYTLWAENAPVVIDNTGGDALTNYQALITMDTTGLIAAGKVNEDGSDIRFLDSDRATELPYWLESGINTTVTKVWIKVPTIGADTTKTIYMYYGNEAATSGSNASVTFQFFDDFDTFDTSIWTKTGSASVADSKLTVLTGSVYTPSTVASSSADMLVESKITWINNSGSYSGMMIANDHATAGSNSGADAFIYTMTDSGGGSNLRAWAGDGTRTGYNLSSNGLLYAFTVGDTEVIGHVTTSDNTIKWFLDETEIKSVSGTWDEPFYVWFGYFTGSVAGGSSVKDIAIDYVRIRTYVASPPSVNLYLPITKVVFTTDAQSIFEDRASSVITVQTRDDTNTPQNVSEDVEIDLTSTSSTGQFSTSADFTSIITSVTIEDGSSSVNVYYRDGTAGSYTLKAAEDPSDDWTDATQAITIKAVELTGEYFRPITITNNLATDLTNFQIKLELDTEAIVDEEKMNEDGSDIRFRDTDDATALYYYIESGMNTDTTEIWVKVPSIPASSDKTIYMYYGNDDATAESSAVNTFDFYDDFASFDTSVWGKTNASSTVVDGQLRVTLGTTYTLDTVADSSADELVESSITWLNNSGSYSGMMIADDHATAGSNSGLDAHLYMMTDSGGGRNMRGWAGDGTVRGYNLSSNGLLYGFTAGDTDLIGFVTTSDNKVKWFREGVEVRSVSGTWDEALYLWFGYFTGSAAGGANCKDIDVDWVRIRKYAATEPTIVVGDESAVVAQIIFTTSMQEVVQDLSSALITVETQSLLGETTAVNVDMQIDLETTSSTGYFAPEDDATDWNADTYFLSIPSGDSEVSFYYKDSTIGSVTVTASEFPSLGWTDGTQIVTITSAVNSFRITPESSTIVANKPFSLTVTALDDDGEISTTFNDPVTLSVNYIDPVSGSGVLSTTEVSTFVEGVATVTDVVFSNCGTVSIVATKSDDSDKYGTSSSIAFLPKDFTFSFADLDSQTPANHTVNKEFGITATAKDYNGATCTDYPGPATLSFEYENPSESQGGTIDPTSVSSSLWNNGLAEIAAASYNKWGEISFIIKDDTLVTQTGTSENIMFLPKDFLLEISEPPASRSYYYTDEVFELTITARDQEEVVVSNYAGTLVLSGEEFNLPEPYAFTSEDSGEHTFEITASDEVEEVKITATDNAYSTLTVESDEIEVKEGYIRVLDNRGPLGSMAMTVLVTDTDGNILEDDDSTTFTISLEEFSDNDSVVSEAEITDQLINSGQATVILINNDPEAVTVTPTSNPVLQAVSGTATYGTISNQGVGINLYRELKSEIKKRER